MRKLVSVALAASLLLPLAASAVPLQLAQQGRLIDSAGAPLDGAYPLDVFLYAVPAGGTAVWSDSLTVNFDDGYYSIDLGDKAANPLHEDDFDGALYYTIAVDGGAEQQRMPLASVPFAIRAQVADGLSDSATIDWSAITNAPVVTDTLADLKCSDGQLARWSTTFDEWYCDTDLSDAEVKAIVEGSPLDLDAGTTIGGQAAYGDSDVRDYVQGTSLNLDPGTSIGGQTIVTGAGYSDSDTKGYVEGNALNLDGGTTIGGSPIATGAHYADSNTKAYVEGTAVNLNSSTTIGGEAISTGAHTDATEYDGGDFALSDQGCSTGRVVTGVDNNGELICEDATTNLHTGAAYRWTRFHTHDRENGWVDGNNGTLFGGISPQSWTDGNAQANQMSSDMEVMRSLFTNKGYGGQNAHVISDVHVTYSSTNGQMAGALFRIENTTNSPIVWTPFWRYTCYSGWSERASVSLNRASNWDSGGTNCGVNNTASVNLSIPPNKISTVVFMVGSDSTSHNGNNLYLRTTRLAFYNNSLSLPNGLQYVDDLDTATAWEQNR